MDLKELENLLINDNLWWQWKNKTILIIYSPKWAEVIELNMRKLPNISAEELRIVLSGGKNVEQITRVTGFFSKVSAWNKGKTGELKERYKSGELSKI